MNCYYVIHQTIRHATRPLRHHLRRHVAFHSVAALSIVCVAGPGALLFMLPPSIAQATPTPVAIPEPATWLMLGMAAFCLAVLHYFRSKPVLTDDDVAPVRGVASAVLYSIGIWCGVAAWMAS